MAVIVDRHDLNPEIVNEVWHKMHNVTEVVVIKVGNESSHFGTHMKVVLTVEEAKKVRDDLTKILGE